MSLDITLYGEDEIVDCRCSNCGHTHTATNQTTLFDVNITHNLNKMAAVAGLYYPLWHPEEIGTKAGELIPALKTGIDALILKADICKELAPSNGWGDYDLLLRVANEYLDACIKNPQATIYVSR